MPYEMTLPPRLRRYTNLNVALDMLANNRIAVTGYGAWVDANDRRGMALYQEALQYQFIGAVCLSMERETFHHWSVFANGPSGVCLHFNVKKFLRMFSDSARFLTEPVQYQLLEKMKNIDASNIHALPFLKRQGFAAEGEYRAVGVSVEPMEVMYVPLLSHAVTRITLSPFLHPALVRCTIDTIQRIDGWENLPIIHSRLTDSRTWERRLKSFVQRHGVVYGEWLSSPIDIEPKDG